MQCIRAQTVFFKRMDVVEQRCVYFCDVFAVRLLKDIGWVYQAKSACLPRIFTPSCKLEVSFRQIISTIQLKLLISSYKYLPRLISTTKIKLFWFVVVCCLCAVFYLQQPKSQIVLRLLNSYVSYDFTTAKGRECTFGTAKKKKNPEFHK